jgi:DNA end-binding protein Ku
MAPRPYWSGHLRLSLVVVPIRLYAAASTRDKISFHKIYKPTGERVHYQNVTEKEGPVDSDKIVKGYEYAKGRYVTLEDEELERVRLESTQVIDLVQFAKADEISPLYLDTPYFVAPDGDFAVEAYSVIREALRKTRMAAIGQLVVARREHVAALRPCGRGMLLETLRYAYEVRKAEDYFADIPAQEVDPEQLELARHLIAQKSKPFDPSKFRDHYEKALRELVEAKLKHRDLPEIAEPRPTGNVIDLMSALKRSLGDGKPPARKSKPSAGKKKTKAKAPARKRAPAKPKRARKAA